jgi:hypothetical protein
MHYTLTAAGWEALEVNESRTFFANSAKRRLPPRLGSEKLTGNRWATIEIRPA